MTDTQLYLAIGIPSMLALINIGVTLTLFIALNSSLSARIQSLEDHTTRSIDNLTGAINDLDKRLTRVEIKLGIQP